MELITLTVLFFLFLSFREWMHKSEKNRLYDQLDEIENKLIESSMARDLTEYTIARRDAHGVTTSEPVVTEPEFINESDLDPESFMKMLEKKGDSN